jgi:hypothetical protein
VAKGRKQLVGLLTADPKTVLEEGAQVAAVPEQPVPMKLIGHVTSSYHSAVLGRSIALALVADGRAKLGETVYIPMPGGAIAAQVVSPVFDDTEGAKLHVEWFAKNAAQAALTDVAECRRWVLRGGEAALPRRCRVRCHAARTSGWRFPCGGYTPSCAVAGPRRDLAMHQSRRWRSSRDCTASRAGNACAFAGGYQPPQLALELSGTHAAWLLNRCARWN